ncbi:hypothetical protein YC2023_041761 [Brassica napus]
MILSLPKAILFETSKAIPSPSRPSPPLSVSSVAVPLRLVRRRPYLFRSSPSPTVSLSRLV